MNKAEDLLLVLQSYAPSPSAEADCSVSYFAALDDGASENDLVLILSESLVSGLKEGKWPWS